MLGAKLRSEKRDQYDALGERGQPVYQAAAQILTTLGRSRADLAAHLAVPQLSADGSVIDWYAPTAGAVVPWSVATDTEKTAALERLAEVRKEFEILWGSKQADEAGPSLYMRLLRWVPQYPDNNHIYIVNDQPVVTFWGFQSANGMTDSTPLHPVHPTAPAAMAAAAAPAAAMAPPVQPPVAAAPVAAVHQPWWKRWWLWLLLLLLLALLLFGLRACMPSATGLPNASGLSWPRFSLPWFGAPATPAIPDIALPSGAGRALPSGGTLPDGVAAAGAAMPAVATGGLPAAADGAANPPPAMPDGASPAPGLPPLPPDIAGDSLPGAPGLPALPPSDAPPAGEPLTLPPGQADGRADFLNGDWGVRAGIQDRNTGQPLRLRYSFEDGQGQVTLVRHNGVVCQAPVGAAMTAGVLDITSHADASCSDGKTFAMPAIHCGAGETDIAACQGSYGDERFPLTMRQIQQ